MTKEICDIKELSTYLKISVSEIRKLVRENKIPHFRLNTAIRFDLIKINKWIEKLEEKQEQISLYY